MSYHPRIESGELASLATIRSRNSELWFINNQQLEDAILSYTAKYAARYEVRMFALGIEGNHLHSLSIYPRGNRAAFQRDLNSSVARAVPRYVKSYPGGRIWARRYSSEFVPAPEDIEEYFFYIVLQPVQDGLVDRISDYPGYNCFSDAINGTSRKFKVINWGKYHDRKRWDPDVELIDFTDIVELKFERLPGYEDLSRTEYRKLMQVKLEQRRQEIVTRRAKSSVGIRALKSKVPGSRPQNTKKGDCYTHRPRILSCCPKRRAEYKAWYFDIYFAYRESSRRFRAGELTVEFPAGTYRPFLFTCNASSLET